MAADMTALLERLRARIAPLRRLAFVAPSREERALFPEAQVLTATEWVGARRPDLRFDLIVAPDGFDDAPDPAACLRNLLASCRVLLAAHRNLSRIVDRVITQRSLTGSAGGSGAPLHVALLRGDLDAPLVRIDDYPTGVRPLLPDPSPLHAVLRAFDECGLPVALGIVPALLEPSMVDFLRSLRHLVPAVHGFDHGYFRHAPRLRRLADPYNERGTVGQFDEFRWQRRGKVERKLRDAKARLESNLARPVTIYIPPCNRVDRSTAHVLRRIGFELCLCEGAVPGGSIPWRRSDFYGRSSEFEAGADAEIITLHVTWEWDLRRRGDNRSLPRMIQVLTGELRDKRAAIARLASDLSSARAS